MAESYGVQESYNVTMEFVVLDRNDLCKEPRDANKWLLTMLNAEILDGRPRMIVKSMKVFREITSVVFETPDGLSR